MIGTHRVWNAIDYRPAIAELLPISLFPNLEPGQSALEIGCGNGSVSLSLASHGLRVLGIDINAGAIATARERAFRGANDLPVAFEHGDVLEMPILGEFDVVLMIRILTCFSVRSAWHDLLHRGNSHLKEAGLIYIHDFLETPENPTYAARYRAGMNLGLGRGNFVVNDDSGKMLFIAHHHSPDDVSEVTAPYETILLQEHESLSMHGNVCNMFEFVGRKVSA